MSKNILLFATLVLIGLNFTACDKDDPEIPNEEELITTLNMSLTSSTGDVIILSFEDLDGDGGSDPIISVDGSLSANETYSGELQLLSDDGTNVESITEEIQEEDEDHQFFFQSIGAELNFQYADQDGNGNPIGLLSTITTGAPDSGSLTIILRHLPNKTAEGVSDNDITNAGGSTDIQVTFPIDVQ